MFANQQIWFTVSLAHPCPESSLSVSVFSTTNATMLGEEESEGGVCSKNIQTHPNVYSDSLSAESGAKSGTAEAGASSSSTSSNRLLHQLTQQQQGI